MPYLVQRNSANGHSHGFVSCVQQTSRLNKHLKEVVVCYVKTVFMYPAFICDNYYFNYMYILQYMCMHVSY